MGEEDQKGFKFLKIILKKKLSLHSISLLYLLYRLLKFAYSAVLCHFSRVQLFATPWTVAHQGPLSMGFSRQEYWSGLPFPPPGDLPDPGISFVSCISRWVLQL